MKKEMFFVALLLCFSVSFAAGSWATWEEAGEWFEASSIGKFFSVANCAPPYAIQNGGAPNGLRGFWISLSVMSLAISISIVALAYIVGHGIQNPGGIAWAKENFFQIIVSALLVVFFLFALGFVDLLSAGFSQGSVRHYPQGLPVQGGSLTMQVAMDFVRAMAKTITMDLMIVVMLNGVIAMVGNLSIQLAPGGLAGVTFNTGYMFRPIIDLLNIVIVMMTTVFGEWFIHMFLLCFANKYMLSIFMPAGIFLRTFPFTRGIGGGLIAISLGFFIVYPAMLNLSAAAVAERYDLVDSDGNPCTLGNGLGCFFKTHFSSDFWGTATGLIGGGGYITVLLLLSSAPAAGSGIMISLFMGIMSMLTDIAYFVVVVGMILPIFNIFITFTFIREISKHLGTDVNIGSLLRVL